MTISIKQKKRIVLNTKEEFDCVLNKGAQIRSSYFVLHYYVDSLSTKADPEGCVSVDKFLSDVSKLGLIIPKRFAKRSVMRSLIKRQCRELFFSFMTICPQGSWVIRLKRPVDGPSWKSSSSPELKKFIRVELQSLFSKAATQFSVSYSLDPKEG